MLRLIRRELEDYILLLLGSVILAAVLVCIIIVWVTTDKATARLVWVPDIMALTFCFLIFFPLAAAMFGAVQMHVDKIRKVPAFLATLATNRGQILTAKIIAGVFCILAAIVPILLTDIILMKKYYPMSVATAGLNIFYGMFGLLLLGCLMSYAVGLLAGTSGSKIVAVLGPIVGVPILLSIVMFKGCGWETVSIFLLITIVVLVNVWQKFKTSSL